MTIALPGVDGSTAYNYAVRQRNVFRTVFTANVFHISLTHWFLMFCWLNLMWRYYFNHYKDLYKYNRLIASQLSNCMLFGLSDILAQCITCYFSREMDPVPRIIDETVQNLIPYNVMPLPGGIFEANEELLDSDNDDNLSVFNDYGEYDNSNDEIEYNHTEKVATFHFRRWLGFMGWGGFISFFQVPWYIILNTIYTEDPTVVQVLERVLTDQLLYSPVSLYFFFMYSNYVIEQGDRYTFSMKIRRLYVTTLGCNYMIWPMMQFINFLVIPKHYHVPFSSSVGVVWNCFLSMRNAAK